MRNTKGDAARHVATCKPGKPGLTGFYWNPSTSFSSSNSFISENEGTGQTKWSLGAYQKKTGWLRAWLHWSDER